MIEVSEVHTHSRTGDIIDISNFQSVPPPDKPVNIQILHCIFYRFEAFRKPVMEFSLSNVFLNERTTCIDAFSVHTIYKYMPCSHTRHPSQQNAFAAFNARVFKEKSSILCRWLSIKIKMLIATFIVSLNKSSKAPPWFSFRFNIMLVGPLWARGAQHRSDQASGLWSRNGLVGLEYWHLG